MKVNLDKMKLKVVEIIEKLYFKTYTKTTYHSNGGIKCETFFKNGEIHRDNLPAVIKYDEKGNKRSEEFWVDGQLHRIEGPAIIKYYDNGEVIHEEFYKDGVEVSQRELEFDFKNKLVDELSVRELSRLLFNCSRENDKLTHKTARELLNEKR